MDGKAIGGLLGAVGGIACGVVIISQTGNILFGTLVTIVFLVIGALIMAKG
jgi:hypothetical protein